FDLGGSDQERDAVGESNDDGARDKAHRGAESGEAQKQKDHAGHDGYDQEAGESVPCNDAGHNDHESAGGAADLNFRSAQSGNQEAPENRGIDAGLGRDTGGNAKRHRQRQSYKADRDTRDHVTDQIAALVAAEAREQLRLPTIPYGSPARPIDFAKQAV